MNRRTVDELQKCAKQHKYFWNGLFAVLYEEIRDQIPIGALTVGSNEEYWIFESITTIKNYLSCKKVLDYLRFEEFCNGIKSDILDKSYIEILPYINKAYAYCEEQTSFTNGKVSKSKKYRQAVLRQTDLQFDSDYVEAKQIDIDEWEHTEIIDTFSILSNEQINLLYYVADNLQCISECDDVFMEYYSRLNEKGQLILLEALEVEQKKPDILQRDEMCDFCRKMTELKTISNQTITPEMLYKKLIDVGFCAPIYAEKLMKYRNATPETWHVLEIYHSVMLTYPEQKIEGFSFDYRDCLLMLLCWLVDIPSLTIN